MKDVLSYVAIAASIVSLSSLSASEKPATTAQGFVKERQIPQTSASAHNGASKTALSAPVEHASNFKPFTGKVVGNGVRMRLSPEIDSQIIRELPKGELIVVSGEKNDFYIVDSPSDLKVYIFRSFVLDNIVEGNRVNIRLAPELNAPVVGFMNAGERVNGAISDKNHKWLEIKPPKNVRFFIAKEYLEKVGGPELKTLRDKKKDALTQLSETAQLFSQSEMMKPFEEIDFSRISQNFTMIINEYSEFPVQIEKAKSLLMELQESYLQKKLAYLESKASRMSKELAANSQLTTLESEESILTPRDRMKIWERVEESHFLAWAANHHQKTMDDYYEDQKLRAVRVSGIVEAYVDMVKNKPGNFIIRDRDMPRAYLYSTFVNLQNYVGKYVTVVAAPRPNNNFAFPAYFILEVE